MEPSDATQALVAEIKLGRMTAPIVAPPPEPPSTSVLAQVEPLGGAPIVAVLPLLPVGSHEMTGWIADAIGEDLVRILAGLREPVVISSNSTRHLRGADNNLVGVAERLGARYLISGSVRMAAAFGRIAVELCEAATGAVIWGEGYDITTSQIFETVEHIAASIANALGPRVNAAELRRSLGQPPDDLGAYHLLLRARDLVFRMERATLEQAGALISEAIRREPGYAGAHAARAYWYSLRIFQGWSRDPEADTAALIESAHTAIRLDPDHARALALLGHNLTLAEHRYEEAEVLVDRAVAAAPNDAEVLITCTPTCAYVGRAAEAVRRAERAMLLSPHDPFLFRYEHFRSLAHYAAGDFDVAAHWGLRSARSNPNFTSNLRITIAALSALGRLEEARPLVKRHKDLQPNYRVARLATTSTFREPEQREQFARLLSVAGMS
jgi:TolB-like protein/Tfp pilus assembly protein PilF